MHPRPKHINSKYHLFCQDFKDGTLHVQNISGNDEAANILTKPPNFDSNNYAMVTVKITQNEGFEYPRILRTPLCRINCTLSFWTILLDYSVKKPETAITWCPY